MRVTLDDMLPDKEGAPGSVAAGDPAYRPAVQRCRRVWLLLNSLGYEMQDNAPELGGYGFWLMPHKLVEPKAGHYYSGQAALGYTLPDRNILWEKEKPARIEQIRTMLMRAEILLGRYAIASERWNWQDMTAWSWHGPLLLCYKPGPMLPW